MAEPLLMLDEVRAGYGDSIVLEGISLVVAKEGSLAVLGRNGVGKTTLMKLLTGYLPCTQGRVLLDDTPITIRNNSFYAGQPEPLLFDLAPFILKAHGDAGTNLARTRETYINSFPRYSPTISESIPCVPGM